MARPKKPEHEARAKLMQIRLQEGEYLAFKEAAGSAGLDLSAWVRVRLRDAAKQDSPRLAKKYLESR